ncbi:MAG: aldehyde ferredoxin oxidoreductase family protein [Bacillota bacterium]
MFKYGGYAGNILRVDLTAGTTAVETLDEKMVRELIGGNGLGIRYLYDNVSAGTNPLAPENALILMNGPVQGTRVPAVGGRTVVLTRSPLSSFLIDSYYGGHFGAELKFAGFDGIVITGRSKKPVMLVVKDGNARIVDASFYWGMKTFEFQEKLCSEEAYRDSEITCIGPAGENLSPMACIISGVHAAGRGGVGAVMGSKQLKAVIATGSGGVSVPDIEALEKYCDSIVERMQANPATSKVLPTYGTPAIVAANNNLGLLGTCNYKIEVFPEADAINGEALHNQAFIKSASCFSCPIGCAKLFRMEGEEYGPVESVGPEYETLWAYGSNLANSDLKSIIAADRFSDEMGLDTISAGSVIGMAIEAFEKGLITTADTGGLELKYGDPALMIALLKQIAANEGFGAVLGAGAREFGRRFNAEKLAMETKGLEIPAHSPRGYPGMAIGYATSNRGGSHQDGRPTAERGGVVNRKQIEGKGEYIVDVQRMTTLADCLVACRFTEGIFGPTGISEDYVYIMKYVTGMDYTVEELVDVADRVYALERAFNAREGASRKDDTLPYRVLHEPIPDGPAAGEFMEPNVFEKELDAYYHKRGWDVKTGLPTEEALRRLKLDDIANDLYQR